MIAVGAVSCGKRGWESEGDGKLDSTVEWEAGECISIGKIEADGQ